MNLKICFLLAAMSCPLFAKEFPDPKGRVNDFAGVLTELSRQSLQARISALEQTTSDELSVVIVSSLHGRTVDDYANRLFREWGIGKKDKNNGVLILVAPNERKVRIEVGYGLEPILPDGLAGEVIRQQMIPQFKSGHFDLGIVEGADRVIEILQEGKPAPVEARIPSSAELISAWPVALVMTAFFSLFVGIGFFMLGAGLGSKTAFPILWGSFFGGIPLLMGMSSLFGALPQRFLPCLGLLAVMLGIRIGRRPKNFLQQKKLAGRHTDGWTWGATSSSGGSGFSGGGGGGGFGGGSSGGGGASGSW